MYKRRKVAYSSFVMSPPAIIEAARGLEFVGLRVGSTKLHQIEETLQGSQYGGIVIRLRGSVAGEP